MSGPRLKICDVRECEAMCCYDGAYLLEGEEEFLSELLQKVPALRAAVPDAFIVDGWWNGERLGRKTATRPQDYSNPAYPAHFTRTRCVFSDAIGYCRLESFARARGQHPWTYKPAVCWLHPLQDDSGTPEAPVASPAEDPYRTPAYPGYSCFTSCGRHCSDGQPWKQALRGEIEYLERARGLPLLGSPGHTVDELLAAGARSAGLAR
jgi:hypothetical protein